MPHTPQTTLEGAFNRACQRRQPSQPALTGSAGRKLSNFFFCRPLFFFFYLGSLPPFRYRHCVEIVLRNLSSVPRFCPVTRRFFPGHIASGLAHLDSRVFLIVWNTRLDDSNHFKLAPSVSRIFFILFWSTH